MHSNTALSDGSIRLHDGKILPPILRPDGTTIKPIKVIQGGKNNRTVTWRRFAPVVNKDGAVIAEPIDHANHSGLRWVKVIEGQATLTRRSRDAGVVFYRDMCLGRVPGVEAAPEKWGLWLAIQEARGRGQVPERGTLPPEKLYHPECAARAARNAGGLERLGSQAIEDLIASVEENMTAEDHARAFAVAKAAGAATDEEISLGKLKMRSSV